MPPSTKGINADDDHGKATEASPASKPATWCTVHYHQVHHTTSVTIRGKQRVSLSYMRVLNKNNNSIRECHCRTWGHLSRSGLFVASWSYTLPYQHWPALTLEQPSTLVLHCRCCWEAPRWHPMRQAAVTVGSSRGATSRRGPAVPLCRLGHLRRSLLLRLLPRTHFTLESRLLQEQDLATGVDSRNLRLRGWRS